MIKFLNKIWLYNSPANVAKRIKNNPSYIVILLLVISNLFAWQKISELELSKGLAERVRGKLIDEQQRIDANTYNHRMMLRFVGSNLKKLDKYGEYDPVADYEERYPYRP